jgi:hypothetical protein
MAQLARALEKIPDEGAAEVAQVAVDEANRRGGSFMGGRVRLGTRVEKGKSRATSTSVFVFGTPAGFWAIKSYGRREVHGGRRGIAPLGGDRFANLKKNGARATTGDRRWDRVVEAAVDASPRVFAESVRKAVGN